MISLIFQACFPERSSHWVRTVFWDWNRSIFLKKKDEVSQSRLVGFLFTRPVYFCTRIEIFNSVAERRGKDETLMKTTQMHVDKHNVHVAHAHELDIGRR